MDDLGWIDSQLGKWKGDASTIARKGLDLAGLETFCESKEPLIVRSRGKPVNPDPYFTQDEIGRMKAELRDLNKFLSSADITWDHPWNESPDLSNRDVTRIFNVVDGMSEDDAGDDYCGFGRLYGPFWVEMKKSARSSLRIDGEVLAYIDFSAMNVHLAYYFAGELPPPTDLYDLTGLLCGYEDKPEWRKPVKKFLSSVWFCRHRQFPREIYFPKREKKKKFKYMDVYTAITRKHPKLKKVLARRMIGYQMARLESDIMMDVLLRLKERAIHGLSIHDGLMVAQSQVGAAREILDQVTFERLGFSIPHKTTFLESKPETSRQLVDSQSIETNYIDHIDLTGGGESSVAGPPLNIPMPCLG